MAQRASACPLGELDLADQARLDEMSSLRWLTPDERGVLSRQGLEQLGELRQLLRIEAELGKVRYAGREAFPVKI